jgi:hypothetical protein
MTLEPAGGESVTAHCSIALLAAATFVMQAADVRAQGAFPAPLPGQSAPAPASNASPFLPVNGAPAASPFPPVNGATAAPARPAASPSAFTSGCASGGRHWPWSAAGWPASWRGRLPERLTPLRADAEAKAKLIQAAGKRKAPPQEACRLIGNFAQAETKMIKFVESHMQKCGILCSGR